LILAEILAVRKLERVPEIAASVSLTDGGERTRTLPAAVAASASDITPATPGIYRILAAAGLIRTSLPRASSAVCRRVSLPLMMQARPSRRRPVPIKPLSIPDMPFWQACSYS
jgi:hypothetical protein